MSNSPLVQYVKISPNSTNPRKSPIRKITIHHMAGMLSVETCGSIFARKDRKASSNYGIGVDGRIAMYVEEKNRAWTSSSPDNDHQAVTIEVANCEIGGLWRVSDLVMERLIELCVDICKRNGITRLNFTGDPSGNLTMHKWFANTICPGPYLESKFPYIAEEVNKRLGAETQQTSRNAIKVGDIVVFKGGKVYTSSNAQTTKVIKPSSMCKVTKIYNGLHPYHCASQDGKGVYGWVDAEAIETINQEFRVKVTASALNIRSGPGTQYPINGTIRDKGVYTIVDTQGDWGKLKSGAGWISLNYTLRL